MESLSLGCGSDDNVLVAGVGCSEVVMRGCFGMYGDGLGEGMKRGS